MKDLVDDHRANIAKAGVKLAERIQDATADYNAEIAASEAALGVLMQKRIEAFNGTLQLTHQPPETSPEGEDQNS